MLQKIICQTCGGLLELSDDGKYGKCPFCQNEYHFKEEKVEALTLMLNLGFENLNRHDFDGAISNFRSVIINYPNDAEANWGLVISTYGIIFEKDDRTGKMIPTCSRIVEKSILENDNYKKAIENAHPEQRPFYEEMARLIDQKQAEIKEIMQNEESFDAFISFKASDKDGRPTQDSRYARKIYDELKGRGIKTFFSPVTLSTRAGEDYEPIIYKALNTCKLFILVATCEEHLNATWVKNEWTRFRDRMDEDKKAIVMPVYSQVEILRLMPTKFQRTQGIDLDRHAFDYDILIADNAETILGIAERKRKEAEERERKEREAREAKEREYLTKKLEELERQARNNNAAKMPRTESVPATRVVRCSVCGDRLNYKAGDETATCPTCYYVNIISSTDSSSSLTSKPEPTPPPRPQLKEQAPPQKTLATRCKELGLEIENTTIVKYYGYATDLSIPEGITAIGATAFSGCRNLEIIRFPKTIKTVRYGAFTGCNFKKVYIESLADWCNIDFDSTDTPAGYDTDLYVNGRAVRELIIPEGVTVIKPYVFYGFKRIMYLRIPNSVKRIGKKAFASSGISFYITIPPSVEIIEEKAFFWCDKIEEISVLRFKSKTNNWSNEWNKKSDSFIGGKHKVTYLGK